MSSSKAQSRGNLRYPVVLLLLPIVAFMVVFMIAPLFTVLDLSFKTHSSTLLWTDEVTLANYTKVFDGYFFDIFVRSIRIAGIATLCCVVLGYPLAYFLARCSPAVLSLGLFLLVMPLMVSTVIRAFGWLVILGGNGILNEIFQTLNLGRVNVLYTELAVVIALVQLVLPLMVLPLMSSIETIPIETEEAAVNLGASSWGVFRQIIYPMSMPGLVSGVILCFAVAISVVVTPALLGGRKARMIGNEIYDQVLTGLNWPVASALSLILIGGVFIVIGIGASLARRYSAGAQ